MTEAAINTGLTRDLYVSLGEPVGEGAWVVRVYHKPFVDWIWGGAFLMALGGVLAITDRRYRLAAQQAVAARWSKRLTAKIRRTNLICSDSHDSRHCTNSRTDH